MVLEPHLAVTGARITVSGIEVRAPGDTAIGEIGCADSVEGSHESPQENFVAFIIKEETWPVYKKCFIDSCREIAYNRCIF